MPQTIVITGGAGFIGANLVHHLHDHTDDHLVIVDKLTYAGNKTYLNDLLDSARVTFIQADIADADAMERVFTTHAPDGIYHLAAESHVDRSITGPAEFINSNIMGTFVLLECARTHWIEQGKPGRFLHVSTDEVFGSLGDTGAFTEETRYDPSSPYSASKAASDHLVRAYQRTYGLDVVLTNCSNNFGPYQYPEKLIPVMIQNIRDLKPLPVYGDGQNVRDWLFVEDHCRALHRVFTKGETGESYNVGTENEWKNLDLVQLLCDLVDEHMSRPQGTGRELITFVTDRPGHDRRYAIDASKIKTELGWSPSHTFPEAIRATVAWYMTNLSELWNL